MPQQFQVFSSSHYQGRPSVSLDVRDSRSPAQDAVSGLHSQHVSPTTITGSDHADGPSWSPSNQEPTYSTSDWTKQGITPPDGFLQGTVDPRPSETTESYPAYDQPSDMSLHAVGSPQLSAFGITGTFISQPTSFLRQSWNVQPETPKSPSVGDERGPAYSAKRMRLSNYSMSSPIGYDANKTVSLMNSPASIGDRSVLHGTNSDTYSVERHQSTPLSPASLPGVSGDGDINRSSKSFASVDESITLRRVSVHSLLSRSTEPDRVLRTNSRSELKLDGRISGVAVNYGYDYGYPDLDLNKNDDNTALEDADLEEHRANDETIAPSQTTFTVGDDVGVKGDYYRRPVPVTIPRYLSPLPPALLENPINLMYFHHFMNHTARILVPHHCSENPFVSVLPSSKCNMQYPYYTI